jgi:parafibromin
VENIRHSQHHKLHTVSYYSRMVDSADSPGSQGKKAKNAHPIIMISSSPTALITLWNVKKFLEQGM